MKERELNWSVRRQLFAGHVVVSRHMKKKDASNDNSTCFYLRKRSDIPRISNVFLFVSSRSRVSRPRS